MRLEKQFAFEFLYIRTYFSISVQDLYIVWAGVVYVPKSSLDWIWKSTMEPKLKFFFNCIGFLKKAFLLFATLPTASVALGAMPLLNLLRMLFRIVPTPWPYEMHPILFLLLIFTFTSGLSITFIVLIGLRVYSGGLPLSLICFMRFGKIKNECSLKGSSLGRH